MNRREELKHDLIDAGEAFPLNAQIFVIGNGLVFALKSVGASQEEFERTVVQYIERLEPSFEDQTLIEAPPEQAIERYKRIVKQRLTRFEALPSLETVSVLFECTLHLIERGVPKELAIAVCKSAWYERPFNIVRKRVPRSNLNGVSRRRN